MSAPVTSLTRAPVNSSTATSADVRAHRGPRALSAAASSASAWSRVSPGVDDASRSTSGRASQPAGLAVACPLRISHEYQLDTAARPSASRRRAHPAASASTAASGSVGQRVGGGLPPGRKGACHDLILVQT